MKTRTGFVSNSSSSSYIIKITNTYNEPISVDKLISENQKEFEDCLNYCGDDFLKDDISKAISSCIWDTKSTKIDPNQSALFYAKGGEDGVFLDYIDFNNDTDKVVAFSIND